MKSNKIYIAILVGCMLFAGCTPFISITSIDHTDCDDANAGITTNVILNGHTAVAYQWNRPDKYDYQTTQNLVNAPKGKYYYAYTFHNGDPERPFVMYSPQMEIFNKVDWTPFGATYNAVDETLNYSGMGASHPDAQSANFLPPYQDGYIEIEVVSIVSPTPAPLPASKIQYADVSLTTDPVIHNAPNFNGTPPPQGRDPFGIDISYQYGETIAVLNDANKTQVTINKSGTSKLRIIRENGQIRYTHNGSEIKDKNGSPVVFDNVLDGLYIDVDFHYTESSTIRVRSSFGCPPASLASSVKYAELQRKIDGGYIESINNTLHFHYFEEYNDVDGLLTYRIIDNDNNEVSGLPALSVNYGPNKFDLDLNAIGLASDFYILEVANEKNEKWYLRFKKI